MPNEPSEWATDTLEKVCAALFPGGGKQDRQAAALVIDREVKALREALLEEVANSICPSTPWDSEMQSYAEGFAEMIRALKEPKP